MTRSLLVLIILVALAGGATATDKPLRFKNMCDASAVVFLDDHTILVAQDETNVLGVYDVADPTSCAKTIDLGPLLDLKDETKEADLEGLARFGDTLFWITSHGRNSDGELKKTRERVGSGTLVRRDGTWDIEKTGFLKKDLREVLASIDDVATTLGTDDDDPELAAEKKGLNIEGLATTPDGTSLMIGLRNPIPHDNALVVRASTTDWPKTIAEDDVFRIDLGKRGVRSIEWDPVHHRYVIVAGPKDGTGSFAIYAWSGDERAPKKLPTTIPNGFRPEGLALAADGKSAILVSDDGDVPYTVKSPDECKDGKMVGDDRCLCKHLKDASRQSFQALRVILP